METLRYLGFLAICAFGATLIIFVGWDEPLRYRFMSPVAIAAEENAMRPVAETPTPAEAPEPVTKESGRDQGPWRMDRDGRR